MSKIIVFPKKNQKFEMILDKISDYRNEISYENKREKEVVQIISKLGYFQK
jgi:hypothetical protein